LRARSGESEPTATIQARRPRAAQGWGRPSCGHPHRHLGLSPP
jgi:hypothetical protein